MSPVHWESALPTYCDSGYEILPLLTSSALEDEAEKTGNCLRSVEDHASICKAGIARTFSILDGFTGERVAMVLITLGDHVMPWKLQWVRGPRNQNILPRIIGVANGIASLYTQNDRAQGTLWTLPPL